MDKIELLEGKSMWENYGKVIRIINVGNYGHSKIWHSKIWHSKKENIS